jgi:CDP-glycerol glycerophosphotransferase
VPRLSIVLVTYREQGFLRRSLTALLAQVDALGDRSGDVEVLVVDDASPDHTGEILAELVAAAGGRLRVHSNELRLGAGEARAAALDLVTGDHMWFAEVTDLLPQGALAAVLDALAAHGSAPRVLVVDHAVRAYDASMRTVAAPPGGTPHLWDTVVATDLARAERGALAGGAWEVRTAWRLAIAAGTVDRLGQVAYVRRALPAVVRRRADGRTPREVAAAYQELLGDPRLARADVEVRRAVIAAAAPPAPSTKTVAPKVRARRLARRLRRDARGWRTLPGKAKGWPAQAYYRAQLRLPLEEDLVVYAAYWGTAYSCNPRAIYEKAREVAPWLRGVWVVDEDKKDRVPAGVPTVLTGSRDYYRALARATYLVNNVNFANDVVKRPGQVHLQTHHGTPLKTMGLDLVDAEAGRKRMNFDRLVKRVARWDFSVSQNVFTTEQWERVYPGTYESLETGYPRNDVLATATPEDVLKVRADLGIEPGQTAVLYTPTHREYHKGFVPQLDPARLAKALGPDHVLLVRAHYFYDESPMGDVPAPGVVDVADHPRIEDLYLAADVLVTDYSSVMFDYAVLDRPIVIYASDWEEYRTRRGTYFDLLAEPPGHVVTTEDALAEVLTSRRAWDDGSTAYRQAFRARFCSLEDGTASERVVRRLWPAPVEESR